MQDDHAAHQQHAMEDMDHGTMEHHRSEDSSQEGSRQMNHVHHQHEQPGHGDLGAG